MANPVIGAQEDHEFRIVVNRSNPIDSLSQDEVSQLFLKQQLEWPGGSPVDPIELPADSPLRQEFSNAIHGRDVKAIEAYWHRKIFQGEGVPPMGTSNEQDVLYFVSANPNAIGYVSRDLVEGADVKVVTLTN